MSAMKNDMTQKRSISQVFVFLLLGVFAVFSTMLVLLGAQLYRETVDQTEQHSGRRLLFNYVSNVVHGNDAADMIRLEERDGIEVLVLGCRIDGEMYETLVYCYEGTLRELFTSAKQEFQPRYGEIICQAQAFEPEIRGGLLSVRITDGNGQESEIHIALRSRWEEHNEQE